jgi:hypothetical protein
MDAVLGRTTKPVTSPPALVFGIALGVAATFYLVGNKPLLGGVPRPAPPPSACLISGPDGFRPLDNVDSLENCGVQLEAVYLEEGQSVTGGYNGMRLFVDDQGIDDAQSDGPRQRLIAPWMRAQIDEELRRLMRKRDGQTGMQITVVRPEGR